MLPYPSHRIANKAHSLEFPLTSILANAAIQQQVPRSQQMEAERADTSAVFARAADRKRSASPRRDPG